MTKGYLLAGWSLLLTVGASLVTLLLTRSAKNRREKKMAEAREKHLRDVMIADKEYEQEHDKRTEDLRDQVEKDGVSGELKDPNKW